MKISAQVTIVMAAIFALVFFSVAFTGFNSLAEMTDPVQIADAKGFAMFWAFLGCVAATMGAISVWIVRTQKDREDA